MNKLTKLIVLFVLVMFINLPLITALEFSEIRAEEVTDNSATIRWETDEPADSFVNYGTDKEDLRLVGDASSLTSHGLSLTNLVNETEYFFSVRSNDETDDNAGSFYSFTTLTPDTTAPELNVEIPALGKGNKLSFNGTSGESNGTSVTVRVYVDGVAVKTETVTGDFSITDIIVPTEKEVNITVEAEDAAGNTASETFLVLADNQKPVIKLAELPELIGEETFQLNGTVSENSSIEIFLNNQSKHKIEGDVIDVKLNLAEGENNLKIVAVDKVGWENSVELTLKADTEPPRVKFELTKGEEFYEGRAETDITGETEPGADVYLFIYQPLAQEYTADFKHALQKVKADEEGKFTFKEVDFPPPRYSSLEQLAPREVPAGLQEILIPHLAELGQEQKKIYKVYVLAEDKSGKVGFDQKTINVNTCTSGDFAFDVQPIIKFQAPFRLDPQLMEEGRETVQSVFNFSYRGNSVGYVKPGTDEVESAYRINTVRFRKACTRNQAEKDDYSLGCKLLPSTLNGEHNSDKSAYYVTAKLQRAADFREKEENLWDDFQKRQLKMPIKILINYNERDEKGGWGAAKTQVACYDLGYFVDIPIESSDLVPDFLANEGVSFLNTTIDAIEDIKPYLRTAMLVTGVSCMGSFFVKMVAKFYRFFQSNFEHWSKKLEKDPDKKCPNEAGQNKLYLDDTIKHWNEIKDHPEAKFPEVVLAEPQKYSLNKKCPSTAAAWDFESYLDQLYRWTCDRFLCRPVPARWTEDKTKEEVAAVRQSQESCSATGTGLPLTPFENCQKELKKNPANTELLVSIQDKPFDCYRDAEGVIYYAPPSRTDQPYINNNIWVLKPIANVLSIGQVPKDDLLVYSPDDGHSFTTGIADTCQNVCKRKSGYQAAQDGFSFSYGGLKKSQGCYKVTDDGYIGQNGAKLTSPKISSGFHTKDCFIDLDNNKDLYICVCEEKKKSDEDAEGKDNFLRTAVRIVDGIEEDWVYRQARVYVESKHKSGTLYPSYRYYNGRDLSGAFGANYLPDYFDIDNPSSTEINPNTDTIGTFQSVCLPGINARLELLQSILIGLRNCILEAKYTGLQDAGMCKTIFTQYVCSLIYKAIAAFTDDCSPVSLKDLDKGGNVEEEGVIGGVGAFFDSGFKAIPSAMQSSIDEVNEDYANSNLQEYFSKGSQGLTESLCLAAFGYDFPIDADFIMDTAYSFPMETSAFMFANRELSTYNPAKGTATFNYEVAGTIMPGCNIRGYRTYLKCIGPDDWGHPNIQCSEDRPCDCQQANNFQTPFEAERKHPIDGGTKFGSFQRNQVIDLPIPSPQKVSKHFRYDHVVLEVILAPGEKPESCFDEGYRTSEGGIFYYPITDVSPPIEASCKPDVTSGRFNCAKLTDFFGGGNTYFEVPYMQCYSKDTDEDVKCESFNLFLINDPIIVRPYMSLGSGKACLKIKDNRNLIDMTIPLPEGTNGPYSPRLNIGTVTEEMVTGGGISTIFKVGGSAAGCGGYGDQLQVLTRPPGASISSQPFQFSYQYFPDGTYQINVPSAVGIESVAGKNYNKNGVLLSVDGRTKLTAAEVNAATFIFNGFRFTRLLDTNIAKSSGICKFQAHPGSTGAHSKGGMNTIRLTASLLQPDSNGNCYTATDLVARSSLGLPTIQKTIRVQTERIQEAVAKSDLHKDFMGGNYPLVLGKAQEVIQLKSASLTEAIAIYYSVASYIMQGKGVVQHSDKINGMLRLFFNRQFTVDEVIEDYSDTVKATGEYKKIEKYLLEVAKKTKFDITAGPTGGAPKSPDQCQAKGFTVDINDIYVYKCLSSTTAQACKDGKEFVAFQISATPTQTHKAALEKACSG